MSDVLDSHEGRPEGRAPRVARDVARRVVPPGWRPHWSLVLAGLVALSVAATLLVAWRLGEPAPSTKDTLPAPTPVLTSSPDASPEVKPLTDLPAWMTGHDTFLVAAVNGATSALSRLSVGQTEVLGVGAPPVPGLLSIGNGGVVVYGQYGERPDARPGPVHFVPAGSTDPVLLGDANTVAPASALASVWLVSGRDARRVHTRTARVLQSVRLPAGERLVAEVVNGLVLRPDRDPAKSYVWDPRTRRRVRLLGGTAYPGASRYAVVLTHPCAGGCTLVVDVVTGATVRTDAFDQPIAAPTLSPDGKWLAGFVSAGDPDSVLVAYDLRARLASRPPVAAPLIWATSLAWSRDGRTLYVGLDDGDRGQVLAWRAGVSFVGVVDERRVHALAVE